jgi:hypothetical protein
VQISTKKGYPQVGRPFSKGRKAPWLASPFTANMGNWIACATTSKNIDQGHTAGNTDGEQHDCNKLTAISECRKKLS